MEALTIKDNEAYLRQISKPVKLYDKDLKKDIEVLEKYCEENAVMAMASVQLGIPKRLIYLKNTNIDIINKMQSNNETEEERSYNENKVLINPKVLAKYGMTDYWEACASCLDNLGHVRRPYGIVLEYYTTEGIKYTDTFEGFPATVLSHELDHLDGILHIDIADQVLLMPQAERKVFSQTHPYNITRKNGDFNILINDPAYQLPLEEKGRQRKREI